eukprot:TRINITY_DN13020_c0_g1_i1.p1 TRINITY_DN13020_c0_g1~~TRINITY_DN13020_c0_g1_i1.p1  ORF type:complete len:377 (+),score=51.00 TRINITY_DN13020_c0_g1_i1:229-1359(+)
MLRSQVAPDAGQIAGDVSHACIGPDKKQATLLNTPRGNESPSPPPGWAAYGVHLSGTQAEQTALSTFPQTKRNLRSSGGSEITDGAGVLPPVPAPSLGLKTASGDTRIYEEKVEEALWKLKKKFESAAAEPEGVETTEPTIFAQTVLEQIRTKGCKVVVLPRRSDVYTTDPEGSEVHMLAELAKEPNVGVCFVIWTPPSGVEFPPHEESATYRQWQKALGKVKVEFRAIGTSADADSLVGTVNKALRDWKEDVGTRMEDVKGDLKKCCHDVSLGIRTFRDQRDAFNKMQPDDYQKLLATGTISEKKDSLVRDLQEKFSDLDNDLSDWRVPSGEFLEKGQGCKFINTTTDRRDKEVQQQIEELKCRTFLFNIMLGQT